MNLWNKEKFPKSKDERNGPLSVESRILRSTNAGDIRLEIQRLEQVVGQVVHLKHVQSYLLERGMNASLSTIFDS